MRQLGWINGAGPAFSVRHKNGKPWTVEEIRAYARKQLELIDEEGLDYDGVTFYPEDRLTFTYTNGKLEIVDQDKNRISAVGPDFNVVKNEYEIVEVF